MQQPPFPLGRFSGPLITEYDPVATKDLGANYWRIFKGYHYFAADGVTSFEVPYGYLTDGATVPRLFQNVVAPWGPWGQAAGGHDILCEYLVVIRNGVQVNITREECDGYLLEMMRTSGVDEDMAQTIYKAVRAYALVSGVKTPTHYAAKQALEASWVNANPEPA